MLQIWKSVIILGYHQRSVSSAKIKHVSTAIWHTISLQGNTILFYALGVHSAFLTHRSRKRHRWPWLPVSIPRCYTPWSNTVAGEDTGTIWGFWRIFSMEFRDLIRVNERMDRDVMGNFEVTIVDMGSWYTRWPEDRDSPIRCRQSSRSWDKSRKHWEQCNPSHRGKKVANNGIVYFLCNEMITEIWWNEDIIDGS